MQKRHGKKFLSAGNLDFCFPIWVKVVHAFIFESLFGQEIITKKILLYRVTVIIYKCHKVLCFGEKYNLRQL